MSHDDYTFNGIDDGLITNINIPRDENKNIDRYYR